MRWLALGAVVVGIAGVAWWFTMRPRTATDPSRPRARTLDEIVASSTPSSSPSSTGTPSAGGASDPRVGPKRVTSPGPKLT